MDASPRCCQGGTRCWTGYDARHLLKLTHYLGFPRFKGRRGRLSCRFTTGAFGLGPDRRHIRLPRIGTVRTHESTRKLARKVETGTARIRSATLSWQRGRWHVAFSVELPDPAPVERTGGRVVGVDLGIKSLAVLSTGQVVSNPRHLDAALTALRRVQRQASRRRGPDRATRTVGSNRWAKTKARVAALHTRVANARRDGLHKLSTRLVREHDVVVVEDLNVRPPTPVCASSSPTGGTRRPRPARRVVR